MPSDEDKRQAIEAQAIEAKVEELEKRARPRRPLGVSVLASLLATYAIVLFVALLWSWSHQDSVRSWMTPSDAERNAQIAWEVVISLPAQMLVAAAVSYGLWNLQRWSRVGILFFAAKVLDPQTSLTVLPSFLAPDFGGELRGIYGRALFLVLVLAAAAYLHSPFVAGVFIRPNEIPGESKEHLFALDVEGKIVADKEKNGDA